MMPEESASALKSASDGSIWHSSMGHGLWPAWGWDEKHAVVDSG